jgi:tRNA(His) 5'-end guanylyltransferase
MSTLPATEAIPAQSIRLPLEVRMRAVEEASKAITTIPDSSSFVIRCDGNNFSTFTRALPTSRLAPYNLFFVEAMSCTAQDLQNKFTCSTILFHSDEVSLIFPPVVHPTTRQYGGDKQKFISIVTAYCSVRFNYHMSTIAAREAVHFSVRTLSLIHACTQTFDGRLLVFEDYELVNYAVWRSQDCHRNAVFAFARTCFSHDVLQNKNTQERITMLQTQGLDWSKVPAYLKYGQYGKKTRMAMPTDLSRHGQTPLPRRVYFKSFQIVGTEDMLQMLLAKYWTVSGREDETLPSVFTSIPPVLFLSSMKRPIAATQVETALRFVQTPKQDTVEQVAVGATTPTPLLIQAGPHTIMCNFQVGNLIRINRCMYTITATRGLQFAFVPLTLPANTNLPAHMIAQLEGSDARNTIMVDIRDGIGVDGVLYKPQFNPQLDVDVLMPVVAC